MQTAIGDTGRYDMFVQRLISGIILVAIMLALFIAGGDVLWLGMIFVSIAGIYELNRVFGIQDKLLSVASYLAVAVWYADLRTPFLPDEMLFVSGYLILLLAIYVFSYPKYRTKQVLAAFFGFFYVALLLSYVYRTRELAGGIYLVWLILLCSWGSDTCAYCVGVLFGKHKMAPVLSPKKSVEGAVGGVAGAMLLTGIYGAVFARQLGIGTDGIVVLAAVSGAGALVSMVGDLAASAIKRNYEIKDYGTLIPGHGGILDRFDSVIITAPLVYYLLVFSSQI